MFHDELYNNILANVACFSWICTVQKLNIDTVMLLLNV